jgi:hypothetical protein
MKRIASIFVNFICDPIHKRNNIHFHLAATLSNMQALHAIHIEHNQTVYPTKFGY